MSVADIGEAIQSAARHLAAHPEEARYRDEPATAVLESGLRFRVHGPKEQLLYSDMPPGVGGARSAPTPGWLLRGAYASCDATLVAMRAAQLGVSLTDLEVTVDSESDDRGLLGLDESIPAGPLSFRVRVRVAAPGVTAEELRQLVEWADHHSPVADAVRRAVPVSLEVEIAP